MLFLNNAINHGVLTPLGIQEAADQGQSVLFLLEANPGPGLGLLMAYTFFGRGLAKASAPGAAIIQFFGGIHEVYFPYVLMKPKMILATIAGGMTGIFLLVLFDVGLRAPAAPGSIFAVYAQTPSGDFFGITVGVFGAALVSFLVGAVLLKMDRSEDGDLTDATSQMEDMKGKKSVASSALAGSAARGRETPIQSIVFACDAGMGSSAMGASVLRRKIQDAGFGDVTVVNKSIASLADEYDIVVTHQDLTDRARQRTGSAIHVSVDNFMGSPRYDEIVEMVQQANGSGSAVMVADREEAPSDDLLARAVGRAPWLRLDPQRGDHRGRRAARRRRRGRAVVHRLHARARGVRVHAHGQRARDPARHQRRQVGHPAERDLVRALPQRDRLERAPGALRGRHRRRG